MRHNVCRNHVNYAASAAMDGLLPSSLPASARIAAGKVTSHAALVNCAQRLVAQVGGVWNSEGGTVRVGGCQCQKELEGGGWHANAHRQLLD
jgi:hypothetical protein